MAVKRITTGSGLTENEGLFFEGVLTPEERARLDELAILHTVEGRLEAIEKACKQVLVAAGLPDGPTPYPGGFANEPWPVVRARGYAPDSREGFAAKMLGVIRLLRQRRADGDTDGALQMMFYLGVNWASSGIKERHAVKSHPIARARTGDRDVELAREFLLRRKKAIKERTTKSDTALKVEIGSEYTIEKDGQRRPRPLSRSSAIDAINRGLKILSG